MRELTCEPSLSPEICKLDDLLFEYSNRLDLSGTRPLPWNWSRRVVDEPTSSTTRAENTTSIDFSFVLVHQEGMVTPMYRVPVSLVLYLNLAISLFQTKAFITRLPKNNLP